MPARAEPYVKAAPNQIIRSGDWNELQIQAREEIRAHDHSGGENGMQIPRAGIRDAAIDGSKIDRGAAVTLAELKAGKLEVNARDVLSEIDALGKSLRDTRAGYLPNTGGTLRGALSIQGDLAVKGSLDLEGDASIGGLTTGAWPANPTRYSFWGVSSLDQAQAQNYALLQNLSNGDTFLNSPKDLHLRIKNSNRLVIRDDKIEASRPLLGAARDSRNRALKIYTHIEPEAGWKAYTPGKGIQIDVDTSKAGFRSLAYYFTSIIGSSGHWESTGATSIYNSTATSFRVYVRYSDGRSLTITDARNRNWRLAWVGIGI